MYLIMHQNMPNRILLCYTYLVLHYIEKAESVLPQSQGGSTLYQTMMTEAIHFIQ
jgi:hypothetical protein